MSTLRITLLPAAIAVVPVFAQDISGTIEGAVLDKSQSAVAKAKVTVTNVDRNQAVREITTDANGIYSAALIPICSTNRASTPRPAYSKPECKVAIGTRLKRSGMHWTWTAPTASSRCGAAVSADILKISANTEMILSPLLKRFA